MRTVRSERVYELFDENDSWQSTRFACKVKPRCQSHCFVIKSLLTQKKADGNISYRPSVVKVEALRSDEETNIDSNALTT